MNLPNASKKVLRGEILEFRKEQASLQEEKIVEQVFLSLKKLIPARFSEHIGIFWPLIGEPDLRSLGPSLEIPLALPASNEDGQLSYHPLTMTPLRLDCKNIPSPIDEPALEPDSMGLLLVPALSIDHLGYRLGYGGGFFDRLRRNSSWRKIPALVVLSQACVSKELLPRDSWDVPFDGWITERGLTSALDKNGSKIIGDKYLSEKSIA